MALPKINWSALYKKEDWWALWIGLLLFIYALISFAVSRDSLGWVPTGTEWTNIANAVRVPNPRLVLGSPWVNLIVTWLVLMLILMGPAKFVGVRPRDWAAGFSLIFWLWWASLIMCGYEPIAKVVTLEFAFTLALVIGLIIGNLPKVPQWLLGSARGEWFIKTAIVLLGAKILFTDWARYGGTALTAALIGFPVAMLLAFPIFRFFTKNTDLSVVSSVGIGVCGVSAAIAAAGAIGAPAIYSTMISAIILIYAVVELVILPYVAAALVKAGFMGPAAAGAMAALSVKTDGAAAATAQVIKSYLGTDVPLTVGVMTKVLIDVWIGVIAFVLALIWIFFVLPRRGRQAGAKPSAWELWFRFPKFVLGYFATSIIASLLVAYLASTTFAAKEAPIDAATRYLSSYLIGKGTDPFRVLFFGLTFVGIGISTRFSLLKQYGIWRLAAAYGLGLLIIILIALGVAKSLFG